MKQLVTNLVCSLLLVCLGASNAMATSLQMGVSVDMVPVSSSFDGTDIVIFGSIEGVARDALYRGEYDVVIKVEGAGEDVVIREKERVFGIWVNTNASTYSNVPSFYSILSANPLDNIAPPEVLKKHGLGIQNVRSKNIMDNEITFSLEPGRFSDAFRRLRERSGLFAENSEKLKQLSPSLFRAQLSLPANVPIGQHMVTAYLFRDGQMLATRESSFRIQKVGFERWIYDLAHEQSLIYGIMAVFMAIFTGWAANVIFRKN